MGALWLDFYTEDPATLGQNTNFVFAGSCFDVLDGSEIVIDQIDRFDASNVRIPDSAAGALYALPAKTRVEVWDADDGFLFRGVIMAPAQAAKEDGSGEITLQIRRDTEECQWARTGMGYVDSNEIGIITANLGDVRNKVNVGTTPRTYDESKFDLTQHDQNGIPGYDSAGRAKRVATLGTTNGWTASFSDNGVFQPTLSPVNWASSYHQNVNINGNTVSKVATGNNAWDAGGLGLPIVYDLTHDFAYSFQIVATQQILQTGLTVPGAFGAAAIDFSIYINNGTWTILEDGALPASPAGTTNNPTTGTLYPNTFFSVVYTAALGKITYYVTPTSGPMNAQGAIPALAPASSFTSNRTVTSGIAPMAMLYSPSSEVTNAIASRVVTNSQLWWKVGYNNATKMGALVQLAKDAYVHIRQAWDSNNRPLRAFELGAFGRDSGITLMDGAGGNARQMARAASNRIVRTIEQDGPDVTNLVNVATPLGGGTGDTQVSVELLWRILNDPKYESFGRYKGGPYEFLGNLFPEYDPNYTLHATADDLGDYEYYMVSENSVSVYGEMQGGSPDSSISIADANPTTAVKELTQRALYSTWIGKFKRSDTPQLTLKITTEGRGKPCRAGDLVHVDYKGLGRVNGVPFVRMHVQDDFTVLSYKRSYNGGDRVDTWELSNDGKYRPTDGTTAAESMRQQGAVQITQNTNQSVSILSPTFRELRANGANDIGGTGGIDGFSVVYPIKLLPTVYRVAAAYIRCDFMPFRQTMTLVEGGEHTHVVLVPQHDHAPVQGLSTDSGAIGGMPTHFHQIPIYSASSAGGAGALIPTQNTDDGTHSSKWTFVFSSGNVFRLTANNSGPGTLETNDQMVRVSQPGPIDLAPSAHPHTFSQTTTITAPAQIAAFNTDTTVETAVAGLHIHITNPDVNDTFLPAEIQVWIDSGTGVFVNRTSQLIDALSGAQGGTITSATAGGFTSSFEIEISRFMNAPGKTIRIKFVSIGSASNPKGLGCLAISGTLAIEYLGLGSIVQQTL